MECTLDIMKVYNKLLQFIISIFVKNAGVYEISSCNDDDTSNYYELLIFGSRKYNLRI